MDCCNYVQAYSGHEHFYQQQHFCYDNMNGYGTYGIAPISDAIEANRRYARLQTLAYPTDYVYNPKEARLRKAMREQSRELSRQSILQTAVVAATSVNVTTTNPCNINNVSTSNSENNGGNIGINGLTNYLNHPMTCASPIPSTVTVSSLSGTATSTYNPSRIANPWFPIGHTPSTSHNMKPILPHRVMQAHQQRTFDNTKEVLRKQTECAGAFSTVSGAIAATCYPSDFTVHGTPTQSSSDTSAGGLESNDYCGIGEFVEGQKWHPYQSTVASYHTRNGPIPKMTNRHGVQNINPHGHGPWNQFCSVPLFSMAPHNSVIRGPRHMMFLRDQQERHCGITTDELPMTYMSNRLDIGHRLPPGYAQSNYKESEKCIEDNSRWEVPTLVCPPHLSIVNNHMTTQRESESRIKEQEQLKKEDTKDCADTSDIIDYQRQSAKTPCKQPLPGFHQAFGSTEIGRFSRSEFFTNMVGDGNGGGNSGGGCASGGSNSGVSIKSNSFIDSTERITLNVHQQSSISSMAYNNDDIVHNNCIANGVGVDTIENCNSLTNITTHCNSVRTKMPKWHSPYVSAIGSEI